MECIVVDNASTDGTPERIQREFPKIRVVIQAENRGFGAANNVGVRAATGAVIALVNPDVVLGEDALARMASYVVQQDDVGIVGPRTFEADGSLAMSARPDYTPLRIAAKYLGLDRLSPTLVYSTYPPMLASADAPLDVDWLQGSCMVMRKSVYEEVGGFDEGFFLYLEDVDLSERVRSAGYRVVYFPDAEVGHEGGTSTQGFHFIRVKNYHDSPLYYYGKRGKHGAVFFLKVVFTVELGAKIIIRTLMQLVRPSTTLAAHRDAEWRVFSQLWQ